MDSSLWGEPGEQQTADLVMTHGRICHCLLLHECNKLTYPLLKIATYHVYSLVREATVATHAWTKLHAEIMS